MLRTATFCLLLLPAMLWGQCLPFIGHPFGNCTLGNISLSTCPAGFDSIIWSNGYQGMWNDELPLGTYSYLIYDNGVVVGADTLEVQQLAWSITNVLAYPSGTGYNIGGWAQVPWCNTSAFNSPCCAPDPALTYIRLVQDGVTEITTTPCVACDNFPCSGTTFLFFDVPPGHTYQVRLYDGSCGEVVTDTTLLVVPGSSTAVAEIGTSASTLVINDQGSECITMLVNGRPATSVRVFDATGVQMHVRFTASGCLDIAGLGSGLYFVEGSNKGQVFVARYLKH